MDPLKIVLLALCGMFAWVAAPSRAQTPGLPTSSTVVIVNALPGPGNLFVKFGAEEIWPPGFTSGQSTGAVAFPAGKKVVEARCEGFITTRHQGELTPKANSAMLFFPGEEIQSGPDKGKRKIALFQPEPLLSEVKGQRWKTILVGVTSPLSLEVNGKALTLQPGKPTEIDQAGKNFIEIKAAGESILAASPEDPGEYWVVVYESQPKKFAAILLNHLAYPVP